MKIKMIDLSQRFPLELTYSRLFYTGQKISCQIPGAYNFPYRPPSSYSFFIGCRQPIIQFVGRKTDQRINHVLRTLTASFIAVDYTLRCTLII